MNIQNDGLGSNVQGAVFTLFRCSVKEHPAKIEVRNLLPNRSGAEWIFLSLCNLELCTTLLLMYLVNDLHISPCVFMVNVFF